MKRKLILFLIIFTLILLSGCGGYTRLDKIQATDYFSGITCEIPLEIPSALPTSEYLHTDDSIIELNSRLDEISAERNNFISEILPYNSLMIVYSENNKTALYLIQEYQLRKSYEPEYNYQYRFSDFSSSLRTDIGKEDGFIVSQIKGIPIPHYLFKEMSSGNYDENEETLVEGDIDKFYKFYQLFQKYYPDYGMGIEVDNNILILKDVPVEIDITNSDGEVKQEAFWLKEVSFTFLKKENNELVVSISIN